MDPYVLGSCILTLAVLIGYLNARYIGIQSTIAIMSGALFLSLVLLLLQYFGFSHVETMTENAVLQTHFRKLLLHGMLSFLLFAGALTIDFDALKSNKWEIGILASITTIASALVVGTVVYYLLPLIGLHLPFLFALLFGALISPTDPIAVLATFKALGAPKSLNVCVAGESLFNDGVGIVIFLTLYQLAFKGVPITPAAITELFLRQALGGIAYGFLLGYAACHLFRHTKEDNMAILITLAIVTGGYNLALALDISGPLAMVVAGIIVGRHLRSTPALGKRSDIMHSFWEVIDEVLNAILFLLIGFELLALKASWLEVSAALLMIPVVLLVRLVTVAIPMKFLQMRKPHSPLAITILTWGGLRGGLAVALALTLPTTPERHFILAMTYAVVCFAIIVQGITIKPLVRYAKLKNTPA